MKTKSFKMNAFFKKFFICLLTMAVIQPSFSFAGKVALTDTEEDRLGNVRLYSPAQPMDEKDYERGNMWRYLAIAAPIMGALSVGGASIPIIINGSLLFNISGMVFGTVFCAFCAVDLCRILENQKPPKGHNLSKDSPFLIKDPLLNPLMTRRFPAKASINSPTSRSF